MGIGIYIIPIFFVLGFGNFVAINSYTVLLLACYVFMVLACYLRGKFVNRWWLLLFGIVAAGFNFFFYFLPLRYQDDQMMLDWYVLTLPYVAVVIAAIPGPSKKVKTESNRST